MAGITPICYISSFAIHYTINMLEKYFLATRKVLYFVVGMKVSLWCTWAPSRLKRRWTAMHEPRLTRSDTTCRALHHISWHEHQKPPSWFQHSAGHGLQHEPLLAMAANAWLCASRSQMSTRCGRYPGLWHRHQWFLIDIHIPDDTHHELPPQVIILGYCRHEHQHEPCRGSCVQDEHHHFAPPPPFPFQPLSASC